MSLSKFICTVYITLTAFFLLAFLVKGQLVPGGRQLAHQTVSSGDTQLGGPFESSGSTSRYVLAQAIVDRGSLLFDYQQAKFASPDVSGTRGRYFSLFQPGVSFFSVPFYWLGRQFNAPQLFTYFSTIVLAICNAALISRLARKLGSGYFPAILGGLLFLFATNALVYALTLTQHHLSTFIILSAALSAFQSRTWLNNIWFGFLFGAGILVDIPNAIILLPLTLYILSQQIELININHLEKVKLNLKLNLLGLLIGLLPVLAAAGWYNYHLTGSYTTFAQVVGRSHDFIDNPSNLAAPGTFKAPFSLRYQIKGLYILLISNQSSLLVYSPAILLGFWGIYLALVKTAAHKHAVITLASIFATNLLLYSLFGDPTGGWSFGSRYLIPGSAILATFTAVVIDKYSRQTLFTLFFSVLTAYSIVVNVIGAMSTTMVPPKAEAVHLPDPIPYTYLYNWQLITDQGLNSSLFYNAYLNRFLTSFQYIALFSFLTFVFLMTVFLLAVIFSLEPVSKLRITIHRPLGLGKLLYAQLVAPLIKLFTEPPRLTFPRQLGDYQYFQPFHATSFNSYRFALYKNSAGQLGVAKIWTGRIPDLAYFLLKNELHLLALITRVSARVYSDLPQEFTNLRLPQLITAVETRTSLVLLKPLISGASADTLSFDRRAVLLRTILAYLQFLGRNLTQAERATLASRRPWQIAIFYPLFLIKAIFNYPRLAGELILGMPVFIKSLPQFLNRNQLELSDRDLHSQNILVTDRQIYLIDIQFGMLSDPLYDLIYQICSQWPETEYRMHLMNHLKNKYPAASDGLIRGLMVHAATHGLTVRNLPAGEINGLQHFIKTALLMEQGSQSLAISHTLSEKTALTI